MSKPLVLSANQKEFAIHPETDGFIPAVIVDVTGLKTVQTAFGEKEKFRLVFETATMSDEGKPICVWSKGYTPSLHEKASFRIDLKEIMGRPLTKEEENSFDVESLLLGFPVKIIVKHSKSEDGKKTYANIGMIKPDTSGTPLKPSGKFVREKDRKKEDGSAASYRKGAAADEDTGREPWQRCKVHVGRNKGLDLGDLDEVAVRGLIDKWLPKYAADDKPTADDKRLAAALAEAKALLMADNPY